MLHSGMLGKRSLVSAVAVVGLSATMLTGCGKAGSSGDQASGNSTATGKGCTAASGDAIVVLQDDKKLQTVDNIIPAVNAKASSPALLSALDKVSDVLTTEDLISLNKQVVVDRKTSPNVAKDYVTSKNLAQGMSGGSGAVKIGAANFAENQTVAEIYRLVLDAAGFKASTQTIGARQVYEPALERGDIDVVPEYVGTLTEFLNKKQNGPDAKALASPDLDKTVSALQNLGKSIGLVFGKPAQAADQNAFAVTKAFADKNGVATLSDLAAKCNGGQLVLGGPPECPKNVFCQPGLEKTYGLKFTGFEPLDAGGPLTKTALKQGKVQVGEVFTSDGSLSS